MTRDLQNRRAEYFRSLHHRERLLVLGNAWDVASAKIFEYEGFEAIGTTSAGVAATVGLPDGQRIDFAEYVDVVRRIVAHVDIPVNVDFEGGFGRDIEAVVHNARHVLETGAIGINIEDENHGRGEDDDPLEPVSHMIGKIGAIRAMSAEYGVSLFINAKTDAVWLNAGADAERSLAMAIDRARAYGDAGADCVFVPGDFDAAQIARIAGSVPCPLNLVIKDQTPPVAALQRLGIKRLSMGSGPMRAAMGLTRQIAREALDSGTYALCLRNGIPYDEVKAMFDR